jgi:hypothetical protein
MPGLLDPNRKITNPAASVPVLTDFLAGLLAHPARVAVHLMRKENMTFEAGEAGAITAVAERGGNGRLLRQASNVLRRPLFVDGADGIHGHSVLRFDGTADINNTDVLEETGAKPTTAFTEVFIMRVKADATATQMTLSGHAGPPNHRIFLNPIDGTVAHQVRNGAQIQVTAQGLVRGKNMFIATTFDGSTGRVGVKVNDGKLETQTDAGLTSIPDTSWYIGGGSSSAASPLTGDIAARLLYNVDAWKAGQETLRDLILGYGSTAYNILV